MFRTGDYGRIADGNIYYEGRADSQVKIRGHRVDLTEINAIINKLDELVSVCVVLSYKAGEPEQVSLIDRGKLSLLNKLTQPSRFVGVR